MVAPTPGLGTVKKLMPGEQPRRCSCGLAQFESQAYDSIHSRFQIYGPGVNCPLFFDQVGECLGIILAGAATVPAQVGEWLGVILVGGVTVLDLPIQLVDQ